MNDFQCLVAVLALIWFVGMIVIFGKKPAPDSKDEK